MRGRCIQGLGVVRALLGKEERQVSQGPTLWVRAPRSQSIPTHSDQHTPRDTHSAPQAYLCIRALLGVGTSHGVHGSLVRVGEEEYGGTAPLVGEQDTL